MAEQHSTPTLPKGTIDLTGKRFNRYLVLGYAGVGVSKGGYRKGANWLCRCDCGTEKVVAGNPLRSGKAQSCGCRAIEIWRSKNIGHNGDEYQVWYSMVKRCKRPLSTQYHNYGGRGITVCERWLVYENFLADMGRRPSKDHSLDRIDGDGCYEPTNCRWATRIEQANNRYNNVKIEYQGFVLTVTEWSRKTGLSSACIAYRIHNGWSAEDALTKPPRIGVSFSTHTDQRTARHLCTEP